VKHAQVLVIAAVVVAVAAVLAALAVAPRAADISVNPQFAAMMIPGVVAGAGSSETDGEGAVWVWTLDEEGGLRLCRASRDARSRPECSPPLTL